MPASAFKAAGSTHRCGSVGSIPTPSANLNGIFFAILYFLAVKTYILCIIQDFPSGVDDVSKVKESNRLKRFFREARGKIVDLWDSMIGSDDSLVSPSPDLEGKDAERLEQLMRDCLNARNQITARRLAAKFGSVYSSLNDEGKTRFFLRLVNQFGHDYGSLRQALNDLETRSGDPEAYRNFLRAKEPPRQRLLRQMNTLPDGFSFLVEMRSDVRRLMSDEPQLKVLDHDLKSLFEYWFDVNLLEFERISWDSPASLLEKLMEYEDVHEISDWEDLKNRLDRDRRCYALTHPKMPGEPLIFVEIALTREISASIETLLNPSAPVLEPDDTSTAVFYSISNTRRGLRGVSFGSFLLKQVVEDLQKELPNLEQFVTLSPLPYFRSWLETQLDEHPQRVHEWPIDREDQPDFEEAVRSPTRDRLEPFRNELESIVASYLVETQRDDGFPHDPVARFHLKNGARFEQINWMANSTQRGLNQSLGLMVNYLYDPDYLEENHRRYMNNQEVITSSQVDKALPS